MLEVRTAVVMNGLVAVGHGKSEIPPINAAAFRERQRPDSCSLPPFA
jgi:hypothetical protein